ncbi:MAG: AEC family transporter [Alphaproteobacteria bacterium]|nr:AEC family transporter [Alphaproteobacteria bacterium]
MALFLHLLVNILPLYALIGLGFVGGKFFRIDRLTLANLVIFIIVPVVMFGYVAQLRFDPAYILLPFIYYGLSAVIAVLFYTIGKKVYPDSRANLLALATTQNNSGYFGLPVIMLLFDVKWTAIYMFINLGGIFVEATIAYYIAARGAFDVKTSLKRLAAYPTLYVVPVGLLYNYVAGHTLPDMVLTYWAYFKGAYVVLGMMIIGTALSQMAHIEFSWRFNSLVFLGKFIAWPLVMGSFVALDIYVLGLYGKEVHTMLILLSIMPPAANVTAFAAQFNTGAEKAATTVLAGTIFALFAIPAVLWLIGF